MIKNNFLNLSYFNEIFYRGNFNTHQILRNIDALIYNKLSENKHNDNSVYRGNDSVYNIKINTDADADAEWNIEYQ